MKKSSIKYIFAILLFGVLGCKKENPTTVNPPLEFVPIYAPCYTGTGEASAHKQTSNWSAGASCISYWASGKKYWMVQLTTCTTDGSFREILAIGGFPDELQKGYFKIIPSGTTHPEGTAAANYGTYQQDGDVVEDIYYQDTTVTNNFAIIDRWDEINKIVEGRFFLSFQIKEPVQNSINPKKVGFSSGQFWATIP